jgi:rubredoxin-NAD+ reductase
MFLVSLLYERRATMAVYVCTVCNWEYNEDLGCPDEGIAPGTKFEDLPDDFECPLCHVSKDMFEQG